ncbi:helix-turn-helix domain-containing protein [Streptomyces sp. NPDC017448]|uniref:helix-turn-helix domain-containing protein n=1 Tax=Streptomyces sp. NPDC017448 TaxID=3364996 RepID=UPI00378BF366
MRSGRPSGRAAGLRPAVPPFSRTRGTGTPCPLEAGDLSVRGTGRERAAGADGANPCAPSTSAPGVLFQRITSSIDRWLHAPGLRPAALPAAHGISLRHLHRVFQQNGTSVSAYVRQRRLERCRRDLTDPDLGHLTVHSLTTRWGFPRPADSTRAFRAAPGLPPSHYRARYAPRVGDAS